MKEWRAWACSAGIEPELIEFFCFKETKDMGTEYKPEVRKTPRTCEYAATSFQLWKKLPKEDRPSQNQMICFLVGLIGTSADALVAFLAERSDRPIPAGDIMEMKYSEVRDYMKGLKARNRNDVFAVLSDGMETFLNAVKDGLNKTQNEVLLTFLEGLPRDILSKLLTGAMSAGNNAGKVFNELASTTQTEDRMSKLMEQSMAVNG
jgi:hypothetical protein